MSIGIYVAGFALILQIAALIVYCVNSTNGYYNDLRVTVAALTVVAIVLTAAGAGMTLKQGNDSMLITLLAVAPILLAVALAIFIGARVETIAWVLGSNLEAGNATAMAAVQQAIAGFVVYAVAMAATIVCVFFKQVKE